MSDYCQVTTAELLRHATAINMGTGEDDHTDGTMRHRRETHPAGKGLEYDMNTRRKKKHFNKSEEPSMNNHNDVSERAKRR